MTSLRLDIHRADRSHDAILRNLLQLYCHDMAQWLLLDAKSDGVYSYPAERLWLAGNHTYLAFLDDIPIGFGLVGSASPYLEDSRATDLHEIFVVRRHRRSGVGRTLAAHIWNRHPGKWLVRVYQGNPAALPFWRTTIADYTGGAYLEESRRISDKPWSWFTFDSAR